MSKINKNILVNYYQKGYSDGYKRHHAHFIEKDKNYIYYITCIVIIFAVFVFYTYSASRKPTHYKGDCLLDLTTSFYTDGCLDN
jgi:membrane-anchored glycerophosphoryl diester phosphodiesterase (GDPDase)